MVITEPCRMTNEGILCWWPWPARTAAWLHLIFVEHGIKAKSRSRTCCRPTKNDNEKNVRRNLDMLL